VTGQRSPYVALAGTLVGLLLLLAGVIRASVIFGYSDEDYAALRQGRVVIVVATLVLVAAGSTLAANGRPVRGLLIMLPGAVCTGAAFARGIGEPYSALVFYPLPAVVALVAAFGALRSSG
jgi:hypothetical protein